MSSTTTRSYTVKGMSCEHCRASVAEEIGEIAGVESVAVDLASGVVEVSGRGFSDDAVTGAVEGAGYELGSV